MNTVAGVCKLGITSTKYREQEHVELYLHSAIHFHYEVYNQTRRAKGLHIHNAKAEKHAFDVVSLLHCAEGIWISESVCRISYYFFSDIKLVIYIGTYLCFGGTYCLRHQFN
jgi:hypothetical protein